MTIRQVALLDLNESFLTKKINFKIQGYDTIRNELQLAEEVVLPSS